MVPAGGPYHLFICKYVCIVSQHIIVYFMRDPSVIIIIVILVFIIVNAVFGTKEKLMGIEFVSHGW